MSVWGSCWALTEAESQLAMLEDGEGEAHLAGSEEEEIETESSTVSSPGKPRASQEAQQSSWDPRKPIFLVDFVEVFSFFDLCFTFSVTTGTEETCAIDCAKLTELAPPKNFCTASLKKKVQW